MHFLVRQSLDRLKAAVAADPAKLPHGFVAVAPRDLETLRRAARGDEIEDLKWPAGRREVCVQRGAAEELIAAVEARETPPVPPPTEPEPAGGDD